MTAETVYTIAKALPEMEYMRLCELLNRGIGKNQNYKELKTNKPILSNREAMCYLLKNVFSEEVVNRNIRNSRKATKIATVTKI
jgi:hypothetical protein